ncbi:MAG: leucine-rich repeat domain-containing protein, partial [Clostridia bacterium]|nr:leucine-rich repeat domain-containing protein [Clostridia bacterium]
TIDGNLYSKDGKTLILYLPGKTDTSFVIPSGVTKISSSAFENCTSLSSVTIPSSVTSIGFAAFNGCTNLSSVIFEDPDGWFVADGRIGGTSVTLTDPSKNATYLNDRYSYYTWQKY